MPGIIGVIGAIMLFVGPFWVASALWKVVRSRDRIVRLEYLVRALAGLYPLGFGLKASLIGPEFLRWHLSDIGFPVAVALGMHLRSLFHPDVSSAESHVKWELQNNRLFKGYVIMALGLSYAYEVFTGVLYTVNAGRLHGGPRGVGSFDIVDMLMYTLGAAAAYGLLRLQRRRLESLLDYIVEEDRQRAVTRKREERRARRTAKAVPVPATAAKKGASLRRRRK